MDVLPCRITQTAMRIFEASGQVPARVKYSQKLNAGATLFQSSTTARSRHQTVGMDGAPPDNLGVLSYSIYKMKMHLIFKYQRLISLGFRLRNKSSISRKSVAKPGLPPRGSATQQSGGGEPHSPLVGPNLPSTSSTCHTQTASTGPPPTAARHKTLQALRWQTCHHDPFRARGPSAKCDFHTAVWCLAAAEEAASGTAVSARQLRASLSNAGRS